MTPDVDLTAAEPAALDSVEALLEEASLPTADLERAPVQLFVCEAADGLVGVGGLESCGEYALLRSVAVEPSARGRGYGTSICEALLERARLDGVSSVFLLTTTAADFFADLGFEPVERGSVPESVRRTEEFADICPSTAVCMRHTLE